jgi:hypothetical protein
MFKIEICKTKGAYSVKPTKRVSLDLNSLKEKFNVIVDTPILLVIKKKYEIIAHKHGELLFKECTDKKEIQKIAEEIYKAGA